MFHVIVRVCIGHKIENDDEGSKRYFPIYRDFDSGWYHIISNKSVTKNATLLL